MKTLNAIIFKCFVIFVLLFSEKVISDIEPLSETNNWFQLDELYTLSGHKDLVNRAFYGPDGNRILTFSDDNTARAWDAETGKQLSVFTGHSETVRGGIFLDKKDHIITVGDDYKIKIWNSSQGKEISTTTLSISEEHFRGVDFSPDASIVALGFMGYSKVYSTKTGQLLFQLSPSGHPGLREGILDIHFSRDGKRIVTAAYSHEISVWDARDGTRILNLHEHGQGSTNAALSPDMIHIATGSRDKTVILWDARLGTIIKKFNMGWEVRSVAFSPDGSTLMVVERRNYDKPAQISFIDLTSQNPAVIINDFMSTHIHNDAFSPDGSRLLLPVGDIVKVFKVNKKNTPAIEKIKDKSLSDLFDLIDTAINGHNAEIRFVAAMSLAYMENSVSDVIPILIDSLNSDNKDIRFNAAITLADISAPIEDAVQPLIQLLQKDPHAKIRTASALAIGNISNKLNKPFAVQELIQSLKDINMSVRYHAAHALDKMKIQNEKVLGSLLEAALHDSATGVRRQVAFNTGNNSLKTLSALPVLIKLTTNDDERVRWWANYIIWCISSGTGKACKDAIPALKKAMVDTSDYRDKNGGPPRKYAMHALGGIGPVVKEVDPEIITMLEYVMDNDDEYSHRKAAALALEKICNITGLRQKVKGYKEILKRKQRRREKLKQK
jgi:HEAT repeat protein